MSDVKMSTDNEKNSLHTSSTNHLATSWLNVIAKMAQKRQVSSEKSSSIICLEMPLGFVSNPIKCKHQV